MRSIIIATLAAVCLVNTVAIASAATWDQTCTNKDGTTHPCTIGMKNRSAHMAACGVEWKAAKSDASVKAAGWPSYWHTCSQKMKAANAGN